jgi:hypothetical protein
MVKNVNIIRRCEGTFDPPILSEAAMFTLRQLYIIFTSPIGGANKKGEALQKIRNAFPIRQDIAF